MTMKGGNTDKDSERGLRAVHPTQKPIELMNWSMRKTNKGDLICDPFGGSLPVKN